MRLAITGAPLTGKTTLSTTLGIERVIHGDDFIGMGWSGSSAAIAGAMANPGPWVAEGVQIPRALRKLLLAEPHRKPCDRLIVLGTPHRELDHGQRTMAKGLETVLAEIAPQLRRLGVEIEHR